MRTVVALLLAVLSPCLAAAPAEAAKPNIVLIVADDLGAMDVGFENPHTFYETPNLDRLASQGVRFSSAYAANPVCSPTRYALLTGRYPTRAALTNWLPGVRVEKFQPAPLARQMPLEETTIAEALRSGGYRTAYVGKWHLGEEEKYWPEAQGFDVNLGGYSAGAPADFFPPYQNPRLSDGPTGEHLSLRLADESARLIGRFHEERKPFFLVFADYAVHNPVQAPPALVEKYRQKAERLGLKDEFGEMEQYQMSAKGPRRVRLSQNHATYAALVETMDQAVGRVLGKLDELGIAGNTLVIFTSDNGGLSTNEGERQPRSFGPASGPVAAEVERRRDRAVPMPTSNQPLRGGKGWLYDGGIRVPTVVRWPGVSTAGAVVSTSISSIDVMPTVLAAAGVPLPEREIDGRDLRPLLTPSAGQWRPRDLFWHYPHYSNQGGFPGGAILADGWKLVENYEDGSVALYYLPEDEAEQQDLAATETERVAAMRARLHAWYPTVGARFLSAAPNGPRPWRP